MKDIGVNHIKFSGCIVSNDVNENNLYHGKIKNIVRNQINASMDLVDNNFNIIDQYHELKENFKKEYSFCPFTQFLTVIGADSKIYTCQDKAYTSKGCLGSIVNRSFKEFWFSNENKEKIFSINPKIMCLHHCVTNEKNRIIHNFLNINSEHESFV